MTKKELATIVDSIVDKSYDDELAHSMEDALHMDLLKQYLPDELWEEIERLNEATFSRWMG